MSRRSEVPVALARAASGTSVTSRADDGIQSVHRIYLTNLTNSLVEEAFVFEYARLIELEPSDDVAAALAELRARIREARAGAVVLHDIDLRELAAMDAKCRAASVEWRLHRRAATAERRAHEAYYRKLLRLHNARPVTCHRCGRTTAVSISVELSDGQRVAMSAHCAALWARGDLGMHTPKLPDPRQLQLFAVAA